MPSNPSRKYLLIQNVSGENLWLNFGITDAPTKAIKLLPDGDFLMDSGFVSTERVSIFGAAAGQGFVAKEG